MYIDHNTVLFIGHDPYDTSHIQTILDQAEKMQFNLLCANRLAGGLKHLTLGGIDTILLNASASEREGLESIARLHAAAPNVPILVISNFSNNGFSGDAISAGAEDHLLKQHIHRDMLIRVLENTIRRKQFRDCLWPGKSHYSKIITQNADAIIVVSRNGLVRYVNPAAEKLFNRHSEELIGTQFGFPMLHDECTEIDIFRKHGEKTVAEMRVVEIEWGNEMVKLATLRDISDRKQTEIALQRYERIIAFSKDLLCLVDREYNFQVANEAFLENYQCNKADVIGRNLAEVFGDKLFSKKVKPKIDRCLSGEELHHQLWLDIPARGRCYADIAYFPYYDLDQAIIGVIIIVRDITQTKTLEVQLQQSQKMEAIGTLAGGIAHDFNNLLMGIQGRASMMLTKGDVNQSDHEHIRGIQEIVSSAADLTKQLLGFARGGKYDVVPTDFNKLIEKSADMFNRTKKEIEIHTHLQPKLWAVEVDKSQFGQVILNLFVNAWQAMPDGGQIHVRTENMVLDDSLTLPFDAESGKYVKVTVTDTGVGMDNATRQRIFDPFFTTKKKQRGSGMGLASAYGIVRNHDGFIDVYSEIQVGTTFTLYIPASDKEVVEQPKSTIVSVKGQESVLLVDDEPLVIDVARGMLEHLGYNVVTAGDGKEALQIFKDNREEIDLVILDMIMPGIGGRITFDKLRRINPDVKVLLSSGYSIDGQARNILDRGCNGFIQKPFTMARLSQKVREILDGCRISA